MLHSPIHSAGALSTPSQRLAAAERSARLERIDAKAKPDTPISCPSASQKAPPATVEKHQDIPPVEPQPEEMTREWFDLQARLNPLPPKRCVDEDPDNPPPLPNIPVRDIQNACAQHWSVTLRDVLSARRTANVVRPRQVAMYLAKLHTPKSLPEIARLFGGRDHTTVLHAVRKITALVASDPALAEDIRCVEQQFPELAHG